MYRERHRQMRRLLLTIIGICLCFHCSAPSSKQTQTYTKKEDSIFGSPIATAFDNAHWTTRPSGKTSTVVGIAGRKHNRDEAIADALLDAERRISLSYGVYGESTVVLQNGSNILDYFGSITYKLYIHNRTESYIDALIFNKEKDVYEKDGAVYVRTRYTGVIGVPSYKSAIKDGKPDWVWAGKQIKIPKISGFLVGIGVSNNKGSLQKTYVASYENAIISLLPSSQIGVSFLEVLGQGRATSEVIENKGDLSEVMIMETWFDNKTKSVWTLLVAKAK